MCSCESYVPRTHDAIGHVTGNIGRYLQEITLWAVEQSMCAVATFKPVCIGIIKLVHSYVDIFVTIASRPLELYMKT